MQQLPGDAGNHERCAQSLVQCAGLYLHSTCWELLLVGGRDLIVRAMLACALWCIVGVALVNISRLTGRLTDGRGR